MIYYLGVMSKVKGENWKKIKDKILISGNESNEIMN